ncbi:TonB-dependent receptor, partial [Bacillus paralicheniformis]|nr:TonB-dependent receptor [Bacillus paralicheniformis]
FVRYAQMSRFPSVYEVGSFYNDVAYAGMPKAPNFRFKPERSRSWEIGYSFNFAPYWSRLRAGDMRLTYYRNRIQNVIETTDYFRTVQYDRKDTAGLEWQSRIDTGRFFAALGATYRLKQQMCDRDTAFDYDPYGAKGVPICIEGGYGSTRGYQAL